MELLPLNDDLVIETRVRPQDIDHVKSGQQATVRLTALNKRMTPMVGGEVVYVMSADACPIMNGATCKTRATATSRGSSSMRPGAGDPRLQRLHQACRRRSSYQDGRTHLLRLPDQAGARQHGALVHSIDASDQGLHGVDRLPDRSPGDRAGQCLSNLLILVRAQDGFGSVPRVDLLHDLPHVHLHGAFAHLQLIGGACSACPDAAQQHRGLAHGKELAVDAVDAVDGTGAFSPCARGSASLRE